MINNKTFINQVAKKAGFTIADVTNVFKAIEAVLEEDIKADEEIKFISGLTIKTSIKEAHEMHSALTGTTIKVPKKRAVKAVFSNGFKERIQ